MSIFDEIAKGGTARPLAAFMVGRENRRQRERQEQIDELNEEFKRKQLEQADERLRLYGEQIKLSGQPRATKLPAAIETYVIASGDSPDIPGFQERFLDFQKKKSTAATTNVTIKSPALENEADKSFGKTVGERAAKRADQAIASSTDDANLDRMLLAIDRGAQTGFGEETILNLKGLGSTLFGIEFSEGDREAEVIRKLSNEMALRLRNPTSGLGLTGSTSNKDLDFLKASVPGLQRSEAGNIKIIEYTKRVNQFKRNVAAEQGRLIAENGGKVPGDLDTKISQFINNYQFFSDEERAELEQINAENKSLVGRAAGILDDPENVAILDDILSRE